MWLKFNKENSFEQLGHIYNSQEYQISDGREI